ncbi:MULTISPECIES: DUF4232 domain-containing protein [unclassified Saccharopolyspora]|uniref:DUF4232 domain-containing protein n=1 Tax=unclassified Saccharopolyspora TaxID=2646250 RepID=UPI001CD812D3|nr:MULTISPECIES: DUF4232 domain-containing protein [unclassified Saccharopolyspora]MCA1189855.1 DUF4232 domain-containing protein [Saccharopolyspora sp. 6T]MCA1228558.1 DUF4232 domain-containing protein [Saccharopolyspora sp. 6M]MCA1283638.1 DUF4232 domain-containing protein [Saccharopolyspora sp. 7B]
MSPVFRTKHTKTAAIAGSALLAGIALAGTAQAMPHDHPDYDEYCTPEQVDVTVGPLNHAMMHEGADVRFTAKPGESCLLGGAPGLNFLDVQGDSAQIPTRYPEGTPEVHRVDEAHPVSAAFSYQVTDPNTGNSIPGSVPGALEISFPGPVSPYSVTVPWNGATVPGPVTVTDLAPLPQP